MIRPLIYPLIPIYYPPILIRPPPTSLKGLISNYKAEIYTLGPMTE